MQNVLFVHIIIVVLCVSIYVRMSVIRAEMTPYRFARDMRTERRTGVTIVVLLLTLNSTLRSVLDEFELSLYRISHDCVF